MANTLKKDSNLDRLEDYWDSLPLDPTTSVEHGDLPQWREVLANIPSRPTPSFQVEEQTPTFPVADNSAEELEQQLKQLHPWRKGPLQIGDVFIDAEWDARQKWNIVLQALETLGGVEGQDILDIGCSNGFYMWHLLNQGAKRVLGAEPYAPNVMQFALCHQLAGKPESIKMWPSTFESMPQNLRAFDTVLSMGVLYHRKNVIEHLMQIRHQLKPGGTMLLETLIIDGDEHTCLVPESRYQQMNNVWFLPSAPHLVRWLERCKFKNITVQDIRPTSIEEQRTTPWMTFHSLEQFLDANDHTKTIEGYQAPTRCLITATAP